MSTQTPWPVTPETQDAWRYGYTLSVRLEAYRGTQRLDLPLDVLGGQVTETDAPGVRATLEVDLAPAPGLWAALSPLGTIVRPYVTTTYGVAQETTPMGVFVVDEQSMAYDGSGRLTLRCPDLWSYVLAHRLEAPVAPRGNAVALAAGYVRAAVGSLLTGELVTASAARVTGKVVYERDRDEVVQALLEASNRVGYVDRLGRLVIAPRPVMRGPGAWEVDPFHGGVLIAADRSRSRARVYNRVIIRAVGTGIFGRVKVDDTDPRSPTFTGGPLGIRPVFVANPFIRTRQQALAVGRSKLRRVTQPTAELDVQAAPNYALTPGTVVPVTLPAQNGDGAAAERHLIASVVHPLPERGSARAQAITVRSSRPDEGEEPDDEEVDP